MVTPQATDDASLAQHPDACWRALRSRDARFDGRFFVGVTSTGVYCRPVCRVRTPRRENCLFFLHAAQAEGAGFRPCLRCRPELAPGSPGWSRQDAAARMAQQAARLLDEPDRWPALGPLMPALAARLGVSDRHLRRLFEGHFGVSPLQYLQTRRLLAAKQLLADTTLPITEVAHASGFGSLRRFNDAFITHYGLNPSRLRRASAPRAGGGATVRLGWRPPYDVQAMLRFLAARQIDAMENIAPEQAFVRVTCRFDDDSEEKQVIGWLTVSFDETRHQAVVEVSDSLRPVLPRVIARVRAAFDLDADPQAINDVLGPHFQGRAGWRVPGALDGFALAVRAVLGQQVTVAAARTLARRLVDALGTPVETPWPGLARLFPTPQAVASAPDDALGRLGIVRQRQRALRALAEAVIDRRLSLHAGSDPQATIDTLQSLPGIGPWTAQYIAMRALRWPDAFPAGDVALQQALGVRGQPRPAQAAQAASQAWAPWRSYAVIRAWATLDDRIPR